MRTARLALADGTLLRGRAMGAAGEASGEVVFNTGMTGYEEVLTDPSYSGQIVTMTFPEIGVCGVNGADAQADRARAAGVVVRSASADASNWRATETLDSWLARHGLVGIAGVDTRALVRRLRTGGAMPGLLCTLEAEADEALLERAKALPGMEGCDLASGVSCAAAYDWSEPSLRVAGDAPPRAAGARPVAVVDYGVKRGILRRLVDAGCAPRVVPCTSRAADILAAAPAGVVLSNGPGDPAAVPGSRDLAAELLGRVPLMGICLGFQILALAIGARTYKLKFGHRGANHPVLDLASGAVEITSQNHGFAVDEGSLTGRAEVTHRSLFDGTVEGISLPAARAFGVQYHPEGSPGPGDARHLFARFVRMVDGA